MHPPIADETKVDSEGNPTSNGPPGATSGPETAGPMTPPPTDPPRMSPQEFASPGLRTPAGTRPKGKEKQEGTIEFGNKRGCWVSRGAGLLMSKEKRPASGHREVG